jgi:hypothetical protein
VPANSREGSNLLFQNQFPLSSMKISLTCKAVEEKFKIMKCLTLLSCRVMTPTYQIDRGLNACFSSNYHLEGPHI